MTIHDLQDLFSPYCRTLPRFMALASAVLSQVIDLASVVSQMGAAYSPVGASGAQLDSLGATLGLSRPLYRGSPVDDDSYRLYIRRKLNLWRWDGSNDTAQAIAEANYPGVVYSDNCNGTVSSSKGSRDLLPVPAAIKLN